MSQKTSAGDLHQEPHYRSVHPDDDSIISENEARYKSILENIEEGYFEVDLKGNFIFFNDALSHILDRSREELMGMNYTEYMKKETANRVFKIFNSVYKTGESAKVYDWEIIMKDGANRMHESSVSLIRNQKGEPIGFRGIVRDVTERKQTEEILRKSEEKYRNILDTMDDIYFEIDLSGNIMFRNKASIKILGYTSDESKGQNYKEFTPPETAKQLYEIYSYVYKTGKLAKVDEYEVIAKDGRRLTLEGTITLLKDTYENPIGFKLLAHDITERKRAELEQRKLESQLQHAQRMESIGTLAGGIAHDFNNLLMSIQGNVSMMLHNLDPFHQHYDRLKNIEYQIKSGSDLTKQLLGFSRGGKYEIKATDINNFVNRMAKMLASTKKDINIKEKYQEKIWTVEIDRGQMNQAILNIFVNACQAMNDGGDLFIRTENVVLDEIFVKNYGARPGQYVKISITDTGIGMDPETLKRVFDPFFTTKDLMRGIGLGLASTYGIIKNHEGIIKVYSEKGLGSTFNIYLPVSDKTVIDEVEPQKQLLKGSETILFVDDEERIVEAGIDMLQLLGYTVVVARNGDEAVMKYSRQKDNIDMIILDLIMPGLDGGEVFERIRVMNPTVKILLSSGYSVDGKAEKILERGCNGFIQKPFTMEQISIKVREILDIQ